MARRRNNIPLADTGWGPIRLPWERKILLRFEVERDRLIAEQSMRSTSSGGEVSESSFVSLLTTFTQSSPPINLRGITRWPGQLGMTMLVHCEYDEGTEVASIDLAIEAASGLANIVLPHFQVLAVSASDSPDIILPLENGHGTWRTTNLNEVTLRFVPSVDYLDHRLFSVTQRVRDTAMAAETDPNTSFLRSTVEGKTAVNTFLYRSGDASLTLAVETDGQPETGPRNLLVAVRELSGSREIFEYVVPLVWRPQSGVLRGLITVGDISEEIEVLVDPEPLTALASTLLDGVRRTVERAADSTTRIAAEQLLRALGADD